MDHAKPFLTPALAKRVLVLLVGISLAQALGGLLARQINQRFPDTPLMWRLDYLFWIDREKNIPAAWSAGLLLTATVLLGALALRTYRARQRAAWGWAGLSVVFVGLAGDEWFEIHESIADPIHQYVSFGGRLAFPWVVVGGTFVLVMAILFGRFVLRQPPRLRRLMIGSAAIFVGGALGVEILGGLAMRTHGKASLLYQGLATVEESMEMLGASLFVFCLLEHLAIQRQAAVAAAAPAEMAPESAAPEARAPGG